jgi:excisionase family DNA binding protein
MADDIGGQTEAGRWLTYEEAARYLRVAPRTVERWVKDGKLRKGVPVGGRAVVWVADADGGQEPDMAAAIDGQERAVLLVDRVSLAVSRQLEAVTAHLASVTSRNEELARENGRLMEQVAGSEREMAAVRQMADAVRQRADHLEAERDAARTELEALKASQTRQTSNLTAESPDPTPEPVPDPFPAPLPPSPNAAPWWRRWLLAVYG